MILVATESAVFAVDPERGSMIPASGLESHHPTELSVDPGDPTVPDGGDDGIDPASPGRATPRRVWCSTRRGGVFRSEDDGLTWRSTGLEQEHVTTVAASPTEEGVVWAGTEPSALWRSDDGGQSWERAGGLLELPSSSEWAFPPKPETHHVRWIACDPRRKGRLWLAIEAGALVTTSDGGRTWKDRVPGGPYDTHELAIHPAKPDALKVAAGDGYFESGDGGETWTAPDRGLEIGYFRSVAIDPRDADVVVISGATGPRTTYVSGRSDGRVYRREGPGSWERVVRGWPHPPGTIAPLLRPGIGEGEIWAADERGVHASEDGGRSWERVAAFEPVPDHLRGLVVLGGLPEGRDGAGTAGTASTGSPNDR